ncbi:MAG: hypothetical protein GY694_12355 [Gammaproteobacteria bacterium]|nr:hypothetical protein [Gammaproteobacteria bacterium]
MVWLLQEVRESTKRGFEMKAVCESKKGELSLIWIYYTKKDSNKIKAVVGNMELYGYNITHIDDGDMFYMLSGDTDLTIKGMREDYSFAKKDVE